MRTTLLKNGYPLDPLNEKIFERCKKLIANLHKTNQVCEIYNIDYKESHNFSIYSKLPRTAMLLPGQMMTSFPQV